MSRPRPSRMATCSTHAWVGGGKKPEKFPRPEIKMDSSAEDWSEFEVEWEYYKEEYTLALPSSGSSMPAAVTSSSRVSRDPQDVGSFRQRNLLKLIRQHAVRYQNPAVHVHEFLGLSQQQDNGVRHYLTRLRGSASRCNFVENCIAAGCDSEVSYADSIIRFKLIAGLRDAEIKEDILSAEDAILVERAVRTVRGSTLSTWVRSPASCNALPG